MDYFLKILTLRMQTLFYFKGIANVYLIKQIKNL